MIKVLLIILLIFIPNVGAKTYYSDYSEYKECDNNILENDITSILKYKKYRYYHESYISDYFMEGENTSNYPYKKDTYKINTYNTNEEPNEKLGRTIIPKVNYKYYKKTDSKIRYVMFRNTSGNTLNYNDLVIKEYENRLNYNLIEENDSYILVDLLQYYDYSNIRFQISLYESTNLEVSLLNDLKDKLYSFIEYNKLDKGDKLIWINYNTNIPYTKLDYEYKIYNSDIIDDNMQIIEENPYYEVNDIYYEYYNLTKEYSGYLEEATDYYNIKDNENYIEACKYKTRDKLEISDELLIYDINYDLNKLIKYSTNKVLITTDLSNKQGMYNINFKLNDISVDEKIVYLDSYNEKYDELLNRYNILENDYNLSITNNDEINNQVDTLNNKNNELKQDYYLLKNKCDEIINKKQSIIDIKLICVGLILVLLGLLSIKNKKH